MAEIAANENARLLADTLVDDVRRQIHDGQGSLDQIPPNVVLIVNNDLWRERVVKRTGELVRFKTFEEFVTTPPLEGLGCDLKTLKNLCRDHREATDAIDRVSASGPGGNNNPWGRSGAPKTNDNNVNNDSSRTSATGNSRDHALNKLRADRPDLHESVLQGDLSPHAAMIEAGFRKKTFSLTEGDTQAAARKLINHGFDPEELYRAMKDGEQ